MRSLAVLVCASLLAVPTVRAATDVVVVGAFVGGSAAGGDPAPDGDGVFFGSGVPAINDSGQVAFYSSFTTGSGGTGVVRGSAAPGDLHLVVRQGDPAPDGNGNFGLFDWRDSPAINQSGQVVFPATFVGTFGPNDTTGVVRGDVGPDHLTLLARSGQSVDGLTLMGLTTPPPVLNDYGEVVSSFLQTMAIILTRNDTNSVFARVGQAAPDMSGMFTLVVNEPAAINNLAEVAFVPAVSGTSGLQVEFLRGSGSDFTQVVRHGDPAPDHNGTFDLATSLGLLHAPALNEEGELAFVAALAGVTGPGTVGIFRASGPDHVVTIVRRGDQTPDHNGSFLDFDLSGINVLALNDAGQAAFLATLTGTSQGSADNSGIFRGDGSHLVRVVRKGDPAPDHDGIFSSFDHPAINNDGTVAFSATLSGTTNTRGMFRYDDAMGLIQVARDGDPLLGKKIAGVAFAPNTSRGKQHNGLSADGLVAFQFGLNDGRQGVAVWSPDSPTTTTGPTSTTLRQTSTTSTTLGPVSSSTVPTTSTTPIPSTTTTTMAPCTAVRCLIDAATHGSSCGDVTVPSSITKKLDLASSRLELAASQPAKKAKRLARSARHLLATARKLVTKASHGRHAKLPAACAGDLVNAINAGAALVGS